MVTHSSILAQGIHGQRGLAGHSPQGHKESDTTERLTHTHSHPTQGTGDIRRARTCSSRHWLGSGGLTCGHRMVTLLRPGSLLKAEGRSQDAVWEVWGSLQVACESWRLARPSAPGAGSPCCPFLVSDFEGHSVCVPGC